MNEIVIDSSVPATSPSIVPNRKRNRWKNQDNSNSNNNNNNNNSNKNNQQQKYAPGTATITFAPSKLNAFNNEKLFLNYAQKNWISDWQEIKSAELTQLQQLIDKLRKSQESGKTIHFIGEYLFCDFSAESNSQSIMTDQTKNDFCNSLYFIGLAYDIVNLLGENYCSLNDDRQIMTKAKLEWHLRNLAVDNSKMNNLFSKHPKNKRFYWSSIRSIIEHMVKQNNEAYQFQLTDSHVTNYVTKFNELDDIMCDLIREVKETSNISQESYLTVVTSDHFDIIKTISEIIYTFCRSFFVQLIQWLEKLANLALRDYRMFALACEVNMDEGADKTFEELTDDAMHIVGLCVGTKWWYTIEPYWSGGILLWKKNAKLFQLLSEMQHKHMDDLINYYKIGSRKMKYITFRLIAPQIQSQKFPLFGGNNFVSFLRLQQEQEVYDYQAKKFGPPPRKRLSKISNTNNKSKDSYDEEDESQHVGFLWQPKQPSRSDVEQLLMKDSDVDVIDDPQTNSPDI